MIKRFSIISLLFLLLQTVSAQFNVASRIDGSPYPVSATPSTIYVINDWGWSEAKRFTTSTLMGLLAKSGNTMLYNESGDGYATWLNDLVANYGVYKDSSYYNNFTGLITHFQYDFDGYILCNLKDNSSNVAVSLCGRYNAIAITSENEALMTKLGKSMLLDVRDKDETWALKNYKSNFSKDIVCVQDENKCMFLSDYAVFADAFQFFDSNINSTLVSDAFSRMNENRVAMGWGPDEGNTVKKISENSLQLNAADWTENLPVLSNFEATLQQHTHSTTINEEDNVHAVCFLVTDGDNLDWLLKDFYGQPKAYGSPNRGQVSIGWTISPAMAELAPTVMKYFYDKATNTSNVKDYFVGSSSGIGYMFPDLYPELQASAELTNEYMKKADLNILNVIGTQYRSADMQKYLEQSNIDAVFFYGNNYASLNGAIYVVNNKPVIGARYRLWNGLDNGTSLAEKLNSQSTDAYSANGYSLIAVHAWSFSKYIVDEINSCVSQLNSNVIVLPPDEFVQRIKKKLGYSTVKKNNLFEKELKIFPNPAHTNSVKLQGRLKKDDSIEITDINNKLVYKNHLKTNCDNSMKINLQNNISNGLYFLKIIRGNTVSTAKFIIQI